MYVAARAQEPSGALENVGVSPLVAATASAREICWRDETANDWALVDVEVQPDVYVVADELEEVVVAAAAAAEEVEGVDEDPATTAEDD